MVIGPGLIRLPISILPPKLLETCILGPGAFIGPNAVIRADEVDSKGEVKSIEIRAECNVQDGVIIHALCGTQVTVGQRTSLAHSCIIHGPCTLGRKLLYWTLSGHI